MSTVFRQQPSGRLQAGNLTQFSYSDKIFTMSKNAWWELSAAIINAVLKVNLAGTWTSSKPVKVWGGASWDTKPLKVWNGTSWIIIL